MCCRITRQRKRRSNLSINGYSQCLLALPVTCEPYIATKNVEPVGKNQSAQNRSQCASSGDKDHWLSADSAHGYRRRVRRAEFNVLISQQQSTKLTNEMLTTADYLVTVCGHADDNCPALPAGTRKEYWPLSDPAKATGSEEEIMAVFRASCDDIRRRVADLVYRLTTDS